MNDYDDEEDYPDPEECDMCGRFNCVCDCICGAYQQGIKAVIQVADCICGRA